MDQWRKNSLYNPCGKKHAQYLQTFTPTLNVMRGKNEAYFNTW